MAKHQKIRILEKTVILLPLRKIASTNPEYKELRCNGVSIWAKVADTDKTRTEGLAGVASLPDHQGMLFDFHDEQSVSFWMKGVNALDLSIAFITKTGVIVDIQDMNAAAPTILHSSPIPVRYALEVPQGYFTRHNIALGDKISL